MSLDIYLTETKNITCDCGRVHVLGPEIVYESNITGNLANMADKAGVYHPLWDGFINGIKIENARHLANILNLAIRYMYAQPEYFRHFDASNGWGTYEQFLPWLEELRDKCLEYPEATISISK